MGREPGDHVDRRSFLTALAAVGLPLVPSEGLPPVAATRAATDFPRNEPSRVQAVVGAAHGDLERVRALVLEQPALAKAAWDWGFGDWESALGAASHTGRREIAELLIGHGARPTLFSAAMLGQVDTVRAYLSPDPGLYHLHGPHGISLFRHALAGGDDAQAVVDYLLDTFGPDEAPFGHPGDEAAAARYGGRYRFDTEPATIIGVAVGGMAGDLLLVGAGEQPSSRVLEVAPDVFHPTGAPSVRLRFEVVDGRAERLVVEDGPLRLTGRRVPD